MSEPGEEVAISTKFKVPLDTLKALVNWYRIRTFDEDLKFLKNEFGSVEGLAEKLYTNLKNGITPIDLEERDLAYGTNAKDKLTVTPFWKLFIGALDDLMLKILIVAAIVSLVISMIFEADHREIAWVEGAAILVAVFVVSFVSSYNDYGKEKQFIKLNSYNDAQNNVNVLRDGSCQIVNFDDLKVGDLVEVKVGMSIPWDAVLIRGTGVVTDESAMTGETIELKKEPFEMWEQRYEEKLEEEKFAKDGSRDRTAHDLPSPILLSGTQIQTGEGWFLVVVVGKNSCIGIIMSKLVTNIEQTPLQEKLEIIARDIGYLGMIAAGITVLVLFIRFFVEQGIKGFNWAGDIGNYLQLWFGYIIIGVTIVVVAVPEGLPLAVMISLAYSVKKMLKDHNFVKRLAAWEIMGGANNICSDKTGTLTKNEMTVTEFWQGDIKKFDVEAEKYVMNEHIHNQMASKLFLEACSWNTSGTSKAAGATEKAILKMLDKFGCNYEELRENHWKEPLVRFQFTSRRKKMSTVLTEIEDNEYRYDKRLHVKGAAEIVLSTWSHYLDKDGVRRELSNELKNKIVSEVIEEFARGALRTICLAYKDLKESEGGLTHDEDDEDKVNKVVEKFGLTCISILGIQDVIRPEVPKAVSQCQTAGIKVRMVTGDNKITALAIAKIWGILGTNHPDAVMEGPQFYERIGGLYCDNCKENSPWDCKPDEVNEKVKNYEAFKVIWKNLDVLARSRPEDKYLLVTGLKQMGDVVAVTGDGTNDAPALKKADVGFAMGITGTDVAKHAAAIILLDDNFASIVKACMWGRNIYDNIRRFLQFQLTVNVNALLIAFIGSCVLRESPLQPIQLLWVNLIMDSLASLALATEPPKENLLERPPYARDEYIISRKMMKHILMMSIFQGIILFTVIFVGDSFVPEDPTYYPRNGSFVQTGREYDWNGDDLYKKYNKNGNDIGPSRHMTVVFNIFVMMQITHMLCWRKIDDSFNVVEGVFTNIMFIIIFISITVIQIIIVQFTQDVFKVARKGLYWGQWLFSFACAFAVFPLNALIKLIPDKLFCDLTRKRKENFGEGEAGETKIEENKMKGNGDNVLRERSSGENHPLNSNEEV